MVMSFKEAVLLCLILCSMLVACMARHVFGDLVFLAEHLIAASFTHAPAVLHLVAGHLG